MRKPASSAKARPVVLAVPSIVHHSERNVVVRIGKLLEAIRRSRRSASGSCPKAPGHAIQRTVADCVTRKEVIDVILLRPRRRANVCARQALRADSATVLPRANLYLPGAGD
jgi:hypothetical protein